MKIVYTGTYKTRIRSRGALIRITPGDEITVTADEGKRMIENGPWSKAEKPKEVSE